LIKEAPRKKPETRNPKPETRNPKLEIRNPKRISNLKSQISDLRGYFLDLSGKTQVLIDRSGSDPPLGETVMRALRGVWTKLRLDGPAEDAP
jgi:hypothetical protein